MDTLPWDSGLPQPTWSDPPRSAVSGGGSRPQGYSTERRCNRLICPRFTANSHQMNQGLMWSLLCLHPQQCTAARLPLACIVWHRNICDFLRSHHVNAHTVRQRYFRNSSDSEGNKRDDDQNKNQENKAPIFVCFCQWNLKSCVSVPLTGVTAFASEAFGTVTLEDVSREGANAVVLTWPCYAGVKS